MMRRLAVSHVSQEEKGSRRVCLMMKCTMCWIHLGGPAGEQRAKGCPKLSQLRIQEEDRPQGEFNCRLELFCNNKYKFITDITAVFITFSIWKCLLLV